MAEMKMGKQMAWLDKAKRMGTTCKELVHFGKNIGQ
jgi:hypothetical protein